MGWVAGPGMIAARFRALLSLYAYRYREGIMTPDEYFRAVNGCGAGKILPEALYLHTQALTEQRGGLFHVSVSCCL